MKILEALCVLAVAFLCPDVEAGPIITMEYTIGLTMITMIAKVNVEGAVVFSKNLIQMKVDNRKLLFGEERGRYEVTCNGNCTNLEFEADEDIMLLASREPVFETDLGCFNCFCVWRKYQRFNPECKNSGNLGSSLFFVYPFNYKGIKSANAIIKGNFKSIVKYSIHSLDGYPYDYKDVYSALALPLYGPTVNDTDISLEVYCKHNTTCTEVKIEILKDNQQSVKIRAGKDTSLDDKGQCKNCDCKDRTSCDTRFNPTLIDADDGFDYFKLDMTLGPSTKKYPAVVRISGKNLHSYADFSVNNHGHYDYDDYFY